jgi:hypothetical protein
LSWVSSTCDISGLPRTKTLLVDSVSREIFERVFLTGRLGCLNSSGSMYQARSSIQDLLHCCLLYQYPKWFTRIRDVLSHRRFNSTNQCQQNSADDLPRQFQLSGIHSIYQTMHFSLFYSCLTLSKPRVARVESVRHGSVDSTKLYHAADEYLNIWVLRLFRVCSEFLLERPSEANHGVDAQG